MAKSDMKVNIMKKTINNTSKIMGKKHFEIFSQSKDKVERDKIKQALLLDK